jgi:subtilase family serine protease
MLSGMRVQLRLGLALIGTALIGLPVTPAAAPQVDARASRPDFDIRDTRPAAVRRATDEDASRGLQVTSEQSRVRINRDSGTVRVLHHPSLTTARTSSHSAIRALLAAHARQFGLERRDLNTLTPVRDYMSRSTGVRHVIFQQVVDGVPVFDSSIAVHVLRDGTISRVTSNAASIEGRVSSANVDAERAREEAAVHAGSSLESAEMPSLTWLPLEGVLRLAWHSVVSTSDDSDVFDVLIDAQTAELLLRRSRVHFTEGSGRVFQGPGTASIDPRRPDASPFGADGTLACPPPVNYAVRSLNTPFHDSATVLSTSGHLEGNNVTVFRGSIGQSAEGTYDGQRWLFDFPFNSAESAETSLFFAMNFAHDFYYDLGFDEAAGNFQVDNFGRGGVGADPVKARARAVGRNNANYVNAPEGKSPTINMFLWDSMGSCWGQDVDGDGFIDVDGDYDLDVVVHEYHHGVSLRINTSFSGPEAGAIGEGGGDFFAYSVSHNPVLAEYSRPGGLRTVNQKGYGDWYCRQSLFCEPHDNGEIWANVLWDVRERFRTNLVRGSEAAAINESHQLYIDGLKLSPPRPTMLDLRDAMLEADAIRNPEGARSQNFCRLWESFAGRGMGLTATDTADNGQNRVGPAYDVPAGCQAPPVPLLVTATAGNATALEAGSVPGTVIIRRSVTSNSPLTVNYVTSGTANTSDYQVPGESATIPAGAATVTVPIVPTDDLLVETDETVILLLRSGDGYAIGSPTSATIAIVSDDVAPDLIVTSLTAPGPAGAGTTIQVADTTRNQGTGPAAASRTVFYVSKNFTLDSADPTIGYRDVPALAAGAVSTGTVSLVLPDPLESGSYYLFAKADGPAGVTETNEINNTRQTSIAVGPDLVVTSLSGPALAAAGATILISDTTLNQGGGAAPDSSTRFFISTSILFNASARPLQARSVGALTAGAASTGTTSVTIPADVAAGPYYLFAQADGNLAVPEPNEANNTRFTNLRIGADLTITSFTAPARAAAGATIIVTDTTTNSGAGAATASTTAFYLSPNLILDASDTRLQPARPVLALAAGQSHSGSTTLTLPNLPPGAWYLLANADDGNAVPEGLETNNVRFAGIQIGPDLTFLSVAAPSSGVGGASITITDTIRNIGAENASGSVTRFYLSLNLVLDASDLELNGNRSVPVLAPNTSNTGSTTFTLPAGTSGNYYIIIVADGGQIVAESNESNNTVARFIQIAPGS